MGVEAILWRRLDVPGHDTCRLVAREAGWRLEGAAVFEAEGAPAHLAYRLDGDTYWRTREGVVRGWMGSSAMDLTIARMPDGTWTLNGDAVPGLEGCVDLDLGFTPATNLFQLRRVALGVGDAADVPVAWLDPAAGTLDELGQRYERLTEVEYWYEAPRFAYAEPLQVGRAGFVEDYPRLWRREG